MANRHFRKIAAAKKKAAESAKKSPAPGTSFPVYCKAPGCTFTGMSDGFAMECPDCGGSLEIETPPVGCYRDARPSHPISEAFAEAEKRLGTPGPGEAITIGVPAEAKAYQPETDLPSYPPYSVGVFVSGKDRGRHNLSGAQAIEYARLALEDPKTLGIEIYDRVNNLVAAGSSEKGLRLIRKLGDVEAEPAKVEEPAAPTLEKPEAPKKAPSEFADLLIDHLKRISKGAGLSWDAQDGIKLWAALADFEDGLVDSAVEKTLNTPHPTGK